MGRLAIANPREGREAPRSRGLAAGRGATGRGGRRSNGGRARSA